MKPGSFYIPSQGIIFRFILQVNEDMFMLINALSLLVMNSQEKQFKEGFIVAYLFFWGFRAQFNWQKWCDKAQ